MPSSRQPPPSPPSNPRDAALSATEAASLSLPASSASFHGGPPPFTCLYFAYGSNLSLQQMARRCPDSLYIGRGRLHNYRWQINQRGYANVVKLNDNEKKSQQRGQCVEGLVYLLTRNDEERLDRSEGVAARCYDRAMLEIELIRAPPSIYAANVSEICASGGPAARVGPSLEGERMPEFQLALVYISLLHYQNGPPAEEYIDRINRGVQDARVLGVTDGFFNAISKYVPFREPSASLPSSSLSKKQGRERGVDWSRRGNIEGGGSKRSRMGSKAIQQLDSRSSTNEPQSRSSAGDNTVLSQRSGQSRSFT